MSELRQEVQERYAAAARAVRDGMAAYDGDAASTCCGSEASSSRPEARSSCRAPQDGLGVMLYDESTRAQLPDDAVLASLGCGNPTTVAELREGEVVLDLGSGGGIDVLLSAARVGPTGTAYGVDMTQEMLLLARKNAREAGALNVEFLQGYIEDLPLPDDAVDVVISNCVINLSTDKPRVIDEIRRVVRPGGRLGISDVVSDDDLTPAQRAERGSFVGCIAGALSFSEYRAELERAGFVDIEVRSTHALADGIHGAIVSAHAPSE